MRNYEYIFKNAKFSYMSFINTKKRKNEIIFNFEPDEDVLNIARKNNIILNKNMYINKEFSINIDKTNKEDLIAFGKALKELDDKNFKETKLWDSDYRKEIEVAKDQLWKLGICNEIKKIVYAELDKEIMVLDNIKTSYDPKYYKAFKKMIK